jgi:hypothetical protein
VSWYGCRSEKSGTGGRDSLDPSKPSRIAEKNQDRELHPWATTSNVVQADAEGTFGFPTRPGRYLAVALPPDAFPSSRDARPNFEQLSRQAIAVQLGERERKRLCRSGSVASERLNGP